MPLDVAVNVSARQLISPGFADMVASVLARTDMDPTALILEMTESIYIEDSGSRHDGTGRTQEDWGSESPWTTSGAAIPR